MTRVSSARFFPLAVLAALAGCSSGGDSTGEVTNRGDFVVLSTEPVDNAQLFLNDSIRIDFNHAIDLDSVDQTTFTFQVFDQIGNQVAEPVAGEFSVGTSPGDSEAGRRLLFTPRLPTNDQFTNGGFRPGRVYQVQLVGGNRFNGTVLRDTSGRGLSLPRTFQFSTSDGATPAQLFRNTAPGGPRRSSFEISPTPETTGVVLNKLGGPPLELRLNFDQPLNPSSVNVPVAVETDPELRNSNSRGRVFLEYDDPELGNNWWIPADAELETNELSGATLVLRPLGVLPNNATVRVVVERTLEDISGESNVANVAYSSVFATFDTRRAYEQQFAGLVEDFELSSHIDMTAAFSEPFAEVGPGYLKAGFDFEGSVTGADFEPTAPETVLNTDFTLVQPKNGAAFNVSGGVFNFRNVTIPAGKTVRGQGTKPMVWLVSGTFEVLGTLSVRGGDGVRVLTSGNADSPKAGGQGVCGGGDGGDGSPSSVRRDLAGGAGKGPLQVAGKGGTGGALSCTAGCNRGSGGGGGSLATQGDPNFKQKVIPPQSPDNVFPVFQQQTGIGGQGCLGAAGAVTRVLEGGQPGPTVFTDARNDNNFWGVGVRYDTNLRITGELSVPIGGGGGGGGGDLSYNNDCSDDVPNFENDSSGGGGGGGGGVLIVKALGPIVIRDTGHVVADGGSGGGGEPSATSARGGGGGGGSGGMVVLMSASRIDIHAHGAGGNVRYAAPENNYDFAISADGGACVTGSTPPVVVGKYGGLSQGSLAAGFATTYDSAPLGGYGGMGIVQLMAPPGDNSDLTNTVLDDNIRVFENGSELAGPPVSGNGGGPRKQAILAWRGFPNGFGQGVDDGGSVINAANADLDGDIRPAPTLLPAPFASQSRLRSRWIDTGATVRRYLGSQVDDDQPRGIVSANAADAGPRYSWSGVVTEPSAAGYADYVIAQGQAQTVFTQVVAPTEILSRNANSTFLDAPAYRVRLSAPAMGSVNDFFVQHEAELLDTDGTVLASYRILSHTAEELVLSPESGALDTVATRLRVRAKFFDIVTNGVSGLGSTYSGSGGQRVPVANVRIGFAFHQDPQDENAQRLPAAEGTFLYDLSDPATQEAVRALGAQFVQWDIIFDTAFRRTAADQPPVLNPETPRPELHFLRLPFRF